MGFLIFLGVVALVVIIAVPIIVLSRVASIERRLGRMEGMLSSGRPSPAATRPQAEILPEAPRTAVPPPTPAPEYAAKPQAAVPEPKPVIPQPAVSAKAAETVLKTTAPAVEETDEAPVKPRTEAEAHITPAVKKTSSGTLHTPAPERTETPVERKPSPLRALFTENWLSKVGIITLVLGVAFFVKYAIDKDWINEIGRVGIGILAGAAILLVGHRLRKNYHLLSSLMVGGGIAVFYITIAIAFREYHLFGSTAAFAILVGITVVAVCLSLLYNRQELALFSLLGGYASPLLASSGTGNYVVLFTFLLILNAGMLVVAMRKRWNIIGIVSYLCTLGFFWGWLFTGFKEQYAGATIFAVLFFVQFYLLALLEYFRKRRITVFQVAVILSNNLSLLLACTLIFKNYPLHIMGLVTILIGAANAVVMGVLMGVRQIDRRMLYLVIAVVLSFVSLAVPVQLKGHVITLFWAAEAVILLWLWQRSRIRVFHGAFLLICVLVLGSYFMDAAKNYVYEYTATGAHSMLPVVINRIFITGMAVIVSLGLCRWLTGRDKNPDGGILPARIVTPALTGALIVIGFLVPLFEIIYQLEPAAYPLRDFMFSAVMIWMVTYAAGMAAVFRRHIADRQWVYMLLFAAAALFVCAGLPAVAYFRWSVFYNSGSSVFLLHYLMWPGVAYLIYELVRNLHSLPRKTMVVFAWLLTAAAVALLSVEADSTTVQIAGNADNYDALLHDVRTFGYPILWGVVAAGLMLWGVRRKTALPRQIALVFFGLIVLKFYVFDVWRMSQTGRIISFVALGIILLAVSFLQQRIKTLVREDEKPENNVPDGTQKQ